jgi:hypothetical protein
MKFKILQRINIPKANNAFAWEADVGDTIIGINVSVNPIVPVYEYYFEEKIETNKNPDLIGKTKTIKLVLDTLFIEINKSFFERI